MNGPRFDRIVPVVTLVLIGLGVVFLIELNPQPLVIDPGLGIPSISIAWPLIAVVALVTGIGVELVARAQPSLYRSGWTTPLLFRGQPVDLALPLWSVPVLTPIAIFSFFRLFRGYLQTNAYLLVLVATFVLLMIVLSAQQYLIGGTERSRRIARSTLSIIAYILAFAIFSAVAFNRYRTLYAFALLFPSVTLLAADLLRGRVGALWIAAASIALILIECYWALNFWPSSWIVTGATMLVVLYVAVGIVQASQSADQHSDGMTRRALAEYGVLGGVLLVAMIVAMSYFRARNIDLRLP